MSVEGGGAGGVAPAFWWSVPCDEVLAVLGSAPSGLTSARAAQRRAELAGGQSDRRGMPRDLTLLLEQFRSPIILMLLFAAALSFAVHDPIDGIIIFVILLFSGLLGWWQERGAANAVAELMSLVATKASVLRDGGVVDVPVPEVVPGDVIQLTAGASLPGDCLILESNSLFAVEAALTGETFPVEKSAGPSPRDAAVNRRANVLYLGTHIASGAARAVVVTTGRATEFGKVAEHLALRPPETGFERGVRRFGYLLMEVTLLLLVFVLAANVYFGRPVLESFLFALSLAVGLTPQLLPAIISVNLAHGAKGMARQKVIVRRLSSIENFGSMNVLCSDKTGTLTEGTVHINTAVDVDGRESDDVLLFAYLNASFESGFVNPIDAAIRVHRTFDLSGYEKLGEAPYDFVRKRLSVALRRAGGGVIVTKGAMLSVLEVCSTADSAAGRVPLAAVRERVEARYRELSEHGLRTLGVAYRELDESRPFGRDSEAEMVFAGLLAVDDPPKADAVAAIRSLAELGVELKMITGDNRLVAANVAGQVGMSDALVLSGPELRAMTDEALRQRAPQVRVFAEVEPNQKERIILALQKSGCIVGYLGDGINDASALHAADVGISVDGAVDVAKEAADLVLLDRDLKVLAAGVRAGRETFANTLKYVHMATSANFGNMFSMAGASLFLPFLPLLPKQVLLTNLLTDFPEMTIATDRVDPEAIAAPRRWDVAFIRRFMIVFGLASTVFDYLTFAVLLLLFAATPAQFRTAWFVESVISASLAVLLIRSRRPFFRSRPSLPLVATTLAVVALVVLLPFTPLAAPLGFEALSASLFAATLAIVLGYLASLELVKRRFYRHAAALVAKQPPAQGQR